MIKNLKKKVVVAMSGGVDSSLAAALLKEEGFDVLGITIHHYDGNESLESAEQAAQNLEIPWHVLNFTKEFKSIVIEYFCNEYLAGRTPNPCVICNLRIKFGLLLEKAKSLGADYLATGHYAINEYAQKSKKFLLKRGVDESKDQSYFLYRLNQDVLPYILFPLGKFKKNQTRELAKKYGLKNYKKSESQEICFIRDDNYRKFLTQHNKNIIKPGKFIDKEGKILGDHQGIPFYTIGQRKGLGVSLNKRMYVTEINFHKNVIILSDDKDLYKDKLLVKDLNFISGDKLSNSIKAEVKIRYNSKKSPAIISPYGEGSVLISFEKPQRAVTPGQSAVFYQGDVVVGGGIIEG
ncbi:MAG: tRNA 2-thiouridine(34) synthase MnmA [Candidatus Caldatribacteriota bacterium]|nr:tRNA 2-thiouridine(34) synthase MnmA [Candidatus Caldatribacteriota bacterium]